MKLPFFDEVREARQQAEAAQEATTLVFQCEAVLNALTVLIRQARALGLEDAPLPGDALIEEAIATFPQAAAVQDIPQGRPDLLSRLGRRQQQIQALNQLLRPVAANQHAAAHALHNWRHQQQAALQDDAFASIRERITEERERQMVAQANLNPLRQRAQQLQPAYLTLSSFLPLAAEEVESAAASELDLMRARNRLMTIASTLQAVCQTLQFQVAVPDPATCLPPRGTLQDLGEMLHALQVTERLIDEERQRVMSAIEAHQSTFDEVASWLEDQLG